MRQLLPQQPVHISQLLKVFLQLLDLLLEKHDLLLHLLADPLELTDASHQLSLLSKKYFWKSIVLCQSRPDLSSPSKVASRQSSSVVSFLYYYRICSNFLTISKDYRSLNSNISLRYRQSCSIFAKLSTISTIYLCSSPRLSQSETERFFYCLSIFLSTLSLLLSSSLRQEFFPCWFSLFSSSKKRRFSSRSCLYLSWLLRFLRFLRKLQAWSLLYSIFQYFPRLRQSNGWLNTDLPVFQVVGLFLKVRNSWLLSSYFSGICCSLALTSLPEPLQSIPPRTV